MVKSPKARKWLRNGLVVALALIGPIVAWMALAASPTVTSVTPLEGPSVGGTNLIITGNGFTDFSAVSPDNFAYTGACRTYTVPETGSYKLETWGAQGGTTGAFAGGRGGYATGVVRLTAGMGLYVCVGGQGTESSRTTNAPYPGGFNGGGGSARSNNGKGKETASGGGATDIRIGANSLFARVIVAGGGGGGVGEQFGASAGGAGGGVNGVTMPNPGAVGSESPGGGGTQTSGGVNGIACTGRGAFGAGGIPCGIGVSDRSGGGGGWFGAGAGLPGGGGSGFVFTESSSVGTGVIGGTYLLDSQYYLSSAETIAGAGAMMPAVNGGTQGGQLGNGYARITQLPYDVTVDGVGCDNIQILSDTQISCIAPAHAAGPVDVEVTIGGVTGKLTNGYTYTDELSISGSDNIMNRNGTEYEISLNYNYTGIITLSDGGRGGTWSGAGVINGNQLRFVNHASMRVTYIPPIEDGGEIVLTATSGVSYVSDAEKTVLVSASSYSFVCYDVDSGSPVYQAFVVPGQTLDCEVMLDGPYEGTIALTDVVGGTTSNLGGVFASSDVRFSDGVFTLTYADTADSSGQTLALTYTSPTWSQLMGEDAMFDGVTYDSLAAGIRSNVFWPVLSATVSPALVSQHNSVRVGLLAQAYNISSVDIPAIDSAGTNGCVNCRARFSLTTYGAPYFGEITLLAEHIPDGEMSAVAGGGSFNNSLPSVTFTFVGSGADRAFTYLPTAVGEHTVFGESKLPVIDDDSITFNVLNSRISIVCSPTYVARGESTDCTMTLVVTDTDVPGIEVEMQDILMGLTEELGGGMIVDTSAGTGNPDGTLVENVYSFCGGQGSLLAGEGCEDPSETYIRTFTYTLLLDTAVDFWEVRLQGHSEEYIPAETSWQLLRVKADTMMLSCTEAYPDCDVSRVAYDQTLQIRPNGTFYGKVQLDDGEGGEFSNNGLMDWVYSGEADEFSYVPMSPGMKTITATVLEVDANSPSGIKVGDTYTFEVMVLANRIELVGPDYVALDAVWEDYYYDVRLNGPYVGVVVFDIWIRDGVVETLLMPDEFLMYGDNIINNDDGTYSCEVSLDDYDEETNTTLACAVHSDKLAVGYEGLKVNYMELRAHSEYDAYMADAAKSIGFVAGDYAVLSGGADATETTIVVPVGVPVSFQLEPNGLFAGTYTIDASEATGILSAVTIAMGMEDWPATNNQTLQTQSVVFTPTASGPMTLTFDANRFDTNTITDPSVFRTQMVNLLVLANSAWIDGPSLLTTGETGYFRLVVDGPYEGTFYLDESSNSEGVDNELTPTSCTFSLDDYDEETNTTVCEFEFSQNVDNYANFVDLFATSGEVNATKRLDLLASGYAVLNDYTIDPTLLDFNAKFGNPITFTLTPNAQYDGEFVITQSWKSSSLAIPIVTNAGTLVSSPVVYSYDDYAGLDQRTAVSKSFTFTPGRFGITILTIETDLGVQEIELRVFDWPVIGGPDTIPLGETSGTYTLTIMGSFLGTMTLSVWDDQVRGDVGDGTGNVGGGAQIMGAAIESNKGGSDTCTFTEDDAEVNQNDPEGTPLTICTFTVTLPSSFAGNYIEIHADDTSVAMENLVSNAHEVAVVATDFEVSPDEVLAAVIGDTLTFVIEPNALHDGNFTINALEGGPLSASTVGFTRADWPSDDTPMSGKEFTYAPQQSGYNNVEVCSTTLGCKTIVIVVMAETMSLTGTTAIQLNSTTMSGSYTLSIPGPYEGTVEFAAADTATGGVIAATFSNDGYCTFSADDFDPVTNTTSCSFSLDLPAGLTPTKHVRITAETAAGDALLPVVSMVTAIMASDYTLSPGVNQTANVGDVITFTITPNAIMTGSFLSSTNGTSSLNTAAVAFAMIDYPNTSNADVSKTLRVTTQTPGIETITVTSALGTKTVEILTWANGVGVTGPDEIKQGTTSGEYKVVVNGPYVGTAALAATLPDGGSGAPATGITMSTSSCVFSLDDYDAVSNTTSCTFTVTVPLGYPANWLNLAVSASGGLSGDATVALTADDFELSSDVDTAETGDILVITITPNSLFDGEFTFDDGDMEGLLIPWGVEFSKSSWPFGTLDQDIPDGRTFLYMPMKPGNITITVCNDELGCQEITIEVTGEDLTLSDPIGGEDGLDGDEDDGGISGSEPGVPSTGLFGVPMSAVVAGGGGLLVCSVAAGTIMLVRKRRGE